MSIVQELENSIDIVELVSKYIRLKKAGTNYKSVCPFPWHSEKTPSFVVSPSKQLAYCFGCHKWGWPLKFIMDLENLDFKEALETLWQLTWKKVDSYDMANNANQKDTYQVFKDISNYYQKCLKNAPDIEKYVNTRWITKEDIDIFHLWFAADGRELYRILKEKWYSDEIIDESKVFLDIKSQKDKFLWRLIFPIQNLRWDIIAFAWRIITSWEPKYLNSPATKFYDKSSILYWIYQWKKQIQDEDYVIICEWYMDTIALHRAWFKNTVCVSWTALTEKQVQILKRLTTKFYLCFDSDNAWENATRLSLEILKNKWLDIRIIQVKDGKDPDEFIKQWGDFSQALKESFSPIWFYLSKLNIPKDIWLDKKRKELKEILEVVKQYSDSLEREIYLKEIAKTFDIKDQVIYDEFNKIKIGKDSYTDTQKEEVITYTNEEKLMAYVLLWENFRKIIEQSILFLEFCSEDFKEFLLWKKTIEEFPLEKKENLKWLSFKIEEEGKTSTQEKIESEVVWLCQKINFDAGNKELRKYQKLVEDFPDNIEYQMKKIELARKIKISWKNR